MIDAQGIAALDLRIRFGSILLLFFAGLILSALALLMGAVYEAPPFARGIVAVAVSGLSWIWGYQLMAEDRSWISLRARFSTIRTGVLWACAAGAGALILVLLVGVKVLTWFGIELPEIPSSDYLAGGLGWLPAAFLIVGIIAPAAEELMFRGLLLDWLRQKMPVWPAIFMSALVFGLVHGIALRSGLTGWLQFGYRTAGGVLMAYLAARYQSLRPSFVLHATNNCFAVLASAFLP